MGPGNREEANNLILEIVEWLHENQAEDDNFGDIVYERFATSSSSFSPYQRLIRGSSAAEILQISTSSSIWIRSSFELRVFLENTLGERLTAEEVENLNRDSFRSWSYSYHENRDAVSITVIQIVDTE